jgi:pyrophosphate--fructose-6-phosphate 1-phosphotransferase
VTHEASPFERERLRYRPALPAALARGLGGIAFAERAATSAARDGEAIRARFPRTFGRPVLELVEGDGPPRKRPLTVGVVLSGGQAPGGHNVIVGLADALRALEPASRVIGFLGGPKGVMRGRQRDLDTETLARYRNTGGFDLIGSGRDKIETPEQFEASRKTCESLGLDGLAIIGGDDSNTNAALLAEHFLEHGVGTTVVGVPKTIDGDLKGGGVETSFGFDTATKVYAELIGNICRDAASAAKYWHFVKLMGRSASHVTLECGLATRPNVTLVGEEVEQRGLMLSEIVEQLASAVRRRAEAGRAYGVCLVPEGLIEFIPEMRSLIGELNRILHDDAEASSRERILRGLGPDARRTFEALPERIQSQLLLDRDAHGNVQVSRIETETLLVEQVERLLARWTVEGTYSARFQSQTHFFGYEGRAAAPSNFDADYTYALGQVAAGLVAFERTGYLAAVSGLSQPPARWRPAAIPLTSLMQLETRKGRETPVIAKALVDLQGAPFGALRDARDVWELEDRYLYPGAIQYFGPPEICGRPTITLSLEQA